MAGATDWQRRAYAARQSIPMPQLNASCEGSACSWATAIEGRILTEFPLTIDDLKTSYGMSVSTCRRSRCLVSGVLCLLALVFLASPRPAAALITGGEGNSPMNDPAGPKGGPGCST